MSEPPDKPRGSRHYLPPPPDDVPEAVDVPRMEPPPASLEAMVRSGRGAPVTAERQWSWVWTAVIVLVIAALAYYVGLQQ